MIGAKIAVPNMLPWLGPSFKGILDTYSGAAAAYSVRRLSGLYSGAAIRVRESSGSTEADIGFDGDGNLDETALLAHCGANDGFVTKWYDQSGSNDAIQATAGSQPKIVSAGTVVKDNGLPALDFDGVDDDMLFDSTGGDTRTVFIAMNTVLDTVSRRFILAENRFDGVSDNAGYIIDTRGNLPNDPLRLTLFDDAINAVDQNSPTLGRRLITATINATQDAIYLDGVSVATGNYIMGSDYTQGSISSINNAIDAKYQEIIIYASDQSANRTGIEGNINGYFSIYP